MKKEKADPLATGPLLPKDDRPVSDMHTRASRAAGASHQTPRLLPSRSDIKTLFFNSLLRIGPAPVGHRQVFCPFVKNMTFFIRCCYFSSFICRLGGAGGSWRGGQARIFQRLKCIQRRQRGGLKRGGSVNWSPFDVGLQVAEALKERPADRRWGVGWGVSSRQAYLSFQMQRNRRSVLAHEVPGLARGAS